VIPGWYVFPIEKIMLYLIKTEWLHHQGKWFLWGYARNWSDRCYCLILWIFTYTFCCCRTSNFGEFFCVTRTTLANNQTSDLHAKWGISFVIRFLICLRWNAQKRNSRTRMRDRVPYYFTYFFDNANMVLVFDIALETWKHIVLFPILMHGWYRAKIVLRTR